MTILLICPIMPIGIMLLPRLVLLDLPRGDGIHCNLFVCAVYSEGLDEAVNGPLAGRVHRVLVMTLVGRGQDDSSFLAEMTVCLVSEEELPAGIQMEGEVEFLRMR
jgi:hypothetical protein